MSFGENLKLARKEKGITQEELAEILQVSRQAISKWEAGVGYPETEKLIAIAKNLNVSLDFLWDNENKEKAEEKNTIYPKTGRIKITTFDGNEAVDCLSVSSKICFPGKNEPPYILSAVDRVGFFGAHSVILGWYNDENSVKAEISEIMKAIANEEQTYQLKYYTNVEFKGILGSANRKEN